MTKELNFFQEEIETTDEELPLFDSAEEQPQIEAHLCQLVKRVIEALLFASQDPLPLQKIRDVTDSIIPLPPRFLKKILKELQEDYISQQRAFRLEFIAQGYLLRTHEEYRPYIEMLYRQKRGEKLSYAATEVLAIIAYKQPITRPQIDAIRGVDSSGTVAQLLERNLIEPIGKLEAPGRPTLYGVTKEFLKHFGLSDVKDLPSFS
jgi:segregation and condensation protein B